MKENINRQGDEYERGLAVPDRRGRLVLPHRVAFAETERAGLSEPGLPGRGRKEKNERRKDVRAGAYFMKGIPRSLQIFRASLSFISA
jgi:hypothetical protein